MSGDETDKKRRLSSMGLLNAGTGKYYQILQLAGLGSGRVEDVTQSPVMMHSTDPRAVGMFTSETQLFPCGVARKARMVPERLMGLPTCMIAVHSWWNLSG